MHKALKTLAATAVAVAAGSAAFPIMAQTQRPGSEGDTISPVQVTANSVRVSYRDLNLDTEGGMGIMRARIHRASYSVCGVNIQPLPQQLNRLGCVSNAKRGAFEQLAAARVRVYALADQVLVLPINH